MARKSSAADSPARLPGSDFDTFCAAESSDDAYDMDEAEVPPSVALAKGARMRGRGKSKVKDKARTGKARKRRGDSSSEGGASIGSRRSELPPGWRMAKDESGSRYYYNAETRQSSWTKPTVATAAAEAVVSPADTALVVAHTAALESQGTAAAAGGRGGACRP